MNETVAYAFFADAILVGHFLFVAFVLCGFVAVLLGKWWGWTWVRNAAFRNTHLAVIVIVIVQAWMGQRCPLTTWEAALRIRAGYAAYTESFIQHWLHRILFFDAPLWVFSLIYTLFGGLVLLMWVIDRADSRRR